MTAGRWDVAVAPPEREGGPYTVTTKRLGGHTDVQQAPTAEEAEALKARILDRLERASEQVQAPGGPCDAG